MIWRMAALLWLCSGAAMACPGMGFQKDELSFSARQLATPRVSTVRAGGTVLLGQCPDLPGVGDDAEGVGDGHAICSRSRVTYQFTNASTSSSTIE